MASQLKTFNVNQFIKWSVDGGQYFGKILNVNADAKQYRAGLPAGQEVEVAFDVVESVEESDFNQFVLSTVDNLLKSISVKMYTQAEFDAQKSMSDKAISQNAEELTALKETNKSLQAELAILRKNQVSLDRYESLAEIKAVAYVLETEDKNVALEALSKMSDTEFNIRLEMAAKAMKLTEQTVTNLPKATDQSASTLPKSTDATMAEATDIAEKTLETAEEEKAAEITAAAAASTSADTSRVPGLKSAVANLFSKDSK